MKAIVAMIGPHDEGMIVQLHVSTSEAAKLKVGDEYDVDFAKADDEDGHAEKKARRSSKA